MKLDHWGGGKLDQMSVWEMGIGREGGVWSGGLRSGLRTAFRPERKTPPSRERWSGDLAAGLRIAFVLALLEAVALAVHLQDVHVVGEPVQQRAGQPLRAQHFGPLLKG